MSDAAPLWISEQDVAANIDIGVAIDALEQTLPLEARGEAKNMPKAHTTFGKKDTLHAIGAVVAGENVVGTKTWAHTEGGANPLVTLWDARDGALLAIIEAFALGQLRTAAISGIATRWLSAENADEMAIIGTGHQALPQVGTVHAVRPLKRVRVFSPNAEHRASFARSLSDTFPFEVVVAESVAQAVAGAPIITLVTRATEPVLEAKDVARAAHVNAVGAIVPERMEFNVDLFGRATTIAVDNIETVANLSREFREHFGPLASPGWKAVQPISAVIAAGQRRKPTDDITIFKAMGMGLSDLALGIKILEIARRRGLGQALPRRVRAAARFTSAAAATAR
jgi:alanine dehydrogenase